MAVLKGAEHRFPQGAPPSDTLYKILAVLFSEREAAIVARLPIKPFKAEKASRVLGLDLTRTRVVLDELASRAILVDVERDGKTTYTLPPPMAGFFEFSMMRIRGDIDQALLGVNGAEGPEKAAIAEEICLGCGLCVRACTSAGVALKPRAERVITPLNSLHRVVVMVIERGLAGPRL